MIEINLLPKELRRKGKAFTFTKAKFYFLIGCAGMALVLILLTVLQQGKVKNLDRRIIEARNRKSQLKETIQLVDALGDIKKKILDRMSVIENLDKDRSTWIEVAEDLSSRVPDNIWLSSFKETPPPAPGPKPAQEDTLQNLEQTFVQENPRVTIEGYAYSINNLATFLTRLFRSYHFQDIELAFIKAVEIDKQKVFSFQLNSDLLYSSQVIQELEKEKGFAIKEEDSDGSQKP
ncbi:MAG: hypothetical protein AMJ90_09470 [candidate division Zixibacteria bacterium SM23_73_2]|nr:MAG: hypothetical protein AMJ90_09470 [candidate division Zixibacteria bacterium SM23_73_2]